MTNHKRNPKMRIMKASGNKTKQQVVRHAGTSAPYLHSLSRRKFMLASGAAAAAFTIVPRHVLGGAGFVAPSEKITVAYIGCGTQGLREMLSMLTLPEVQIVAVCDPVKESNQYVDWSP